MMKSLIGPLSLIVFVLLAAVSGSCVTSAAQTQDAKASKVRQLDEGYAVFGIQAGGNCVYFTRSGDIAVAPVGPHGC